MQTYEEYRYDATFWTSFLDKIGFVSAISSELDCIRPALFLPLLLKFFLSCALKFLQSYEVGVPNTVKDFVNSLLFIVSYICMLILQMHRQGEAVHAQHVGK